MNISDFTYLLQRPENINKDQTDATGAIIKEFPYFQAARAVHLKGLKNQDSFKYNTNLKAAAAYTTDRSILFDFITSKAFQQHAISNTIKDGGSNINDIEIEVDEVKVDKNIIIDNAIKEKIKEANAVLDPNLFQPKTEVTPIEETQKISEEKTAPIAPSTETKEVVEEKAESSPEEILAIGKPLAFDTNERHSFSEWLQLTKAKPIDRSSDKKEEETTKEIQEETVSKNEKFDLIDKFIAANPKIKPTKSATVSIDLSQQNSVEQSMLMTETLAKVYLEQKKYKKAIRAYNILILKYPEKSGFFADQIRAIKKLQQNN